MMLDFSISAKKEKKKLWPFVYKMVTFNKVVKI